MRSGADLIGGRLARLPVVAINTNFDEFVVSQGPIHLSNERVGQTRLPHPDDGLEVVGAGLQVGYDHGKSG